MLSKLNDQALSLLVDPRKRQEPRFVTEFLDQQRTLDRRGRVDPLLIEHFDSGGDSRVSKAFISLQPREDSNARSVTQIQLIRLRLGELVASRYEQSNHSHDISVGILVSQPFSLQQEKHAAICRLGKATQDALDLDRLAGSDDVFVVNSFDPVLCDTRGLYLAAKATERYKDQRQQKHRRVSFHYA